MTAADAKTGAQLAHDLDRINDMITQVTAATDIADGKTITLNNADGSTVAVPTDLLDFATLKTSLLAQLNSTKTSKETDLAAL